MLYEELTPSQTQQAVRFLYQSLQQIQAYPHQQTYRILSANHPIMSMLLRCRTGMAVLIALSFRASGRQGQVHEVELSSEIRREMIEGFVEVLGQVLQLSEMQEWNQHHSKWFTLKAVQMIGAPQK